MNDLARNFLCQGCPKLKCEIEDTGSKFGVDYITFKSQKRYIIEDNPDVSWNEIMKIRDEFVSNYVPKFGKYEIEEFVGYKLMEALFITKDITGLLNSELLCDDSPFNITRIKQDRLKAKIMKCFYVLDADENNVTLVYKWKPNHELE